MDLTTRRLAAAAVLPFALLGACNTRARGLEDAPIDQRHIDHTPAQVLDFPNRFGNVTMKCDHHGHRVYATTQHAVTVVVDSSCPSDWSETGK